ncbi:MAG: GNAT family N-acetyltransferase [Limisphaerales bacterium]
MKNRRLQKRSPPTVRILPGSPTPLDGLFDPRGICVIGVSEAEGDPGCRILSNLAAGPDRVHVVRGSGDREGSDCAEILGRPVVSDPGEIPDVPDLAILTVPPAEAARWIRACGRAGIRLALLVSESWSERRARGGVERVESNLLEAAREWGVRLLGPGSHGLMVPRASLNASLEGPLARVGNVAFLSQSGALLASVLDWGRREQLGFSVLASLGGMADIGWGDLIDFLGNDPFTRSIVLCLETVGDARKLLSAAREVSLSKPVIVLRVGGGEGGGGSAGGESLDDRVLDAAFRRAGVLRVGSVAEMFDMAEVLGKQPRPSGPRLAIVTNAKEPGALAASALLASGGALAELEEPVRDSLRGFLPGSWDAGNPIFLGEEAAPETYGRVLETLGGDGGNDGILVLLAPVRMSDPTGTAEVLARWKPPSGKPILTSWMGGDSVRNANAILNGAGFPTSPYPDDAARAFSHMWRYAYALRGIYETPAQVADPRDQAVDRARVEAVLSAVRSSDRTLLTEAESKELLESHGIPVRPMWAHDGFELLLGSRIDARFGPVVVFGTGGSLADVFGDQALGIPPLNATLALRLMEQTRIFRALREGRGRRSVDLSALEALLIRFSYLVVEQAGIAEISINPLVAASDALVAVDVRVALHPSDRDPASLPRSAIRPYPNQYVGKVKLKDGTRVTLRPIRPEDEPRLVEFHGTLSDRSVYHRYFVPMKLSERIAHERLVRVCFSDYDRDIPLVAEVSPSDRGASSRIIGIGRVGREHQGDSGEFAVIISDAWQGKGLGRKLLERLIQVARAEGMTRLTGHVLWENREMQSLCRKVGFAFRHSPGDAECVVDFSL